MKDKENDSNESQITASVRDYFETDNFSRVFRNSKFVSINYDFAINIKGEVSKKNWNYTIYQRLNFDYESNAVYSYLYISKIDSETDLVQMCCGLIDFFVTNPLDTAPQAIKNNSIKLRDNELDRFQSSHTLIDTRLLVFYLEIEMSESEKIKIYHYGESKKMFVKIRDQKYAKLKSMEERPLAFISHDSRDKDKIARPLAQELTKQIGRVWFDEFSLEIGDSLRESIEKGLRECERCVLILTPSFLSNTGWTKVEFNSVFTRELIEKKNVVIPVWVGVTPEQVYAYSPSLADRLAANWEDGIEIVSKKIKKAIFDK